MPDITFAEWLKEKGYDAYGFTHEHTGQASIRIGGDVLPETDLPKSMKYSELHREYLFRNK